MKNNITIAAPQTTSSGPRCLSGGRVRPEEAASADDQDLALLPQVAGQEDDHGELAELGRLEADRAEVDVDVGAGRVDHAAVDQARIRGEASRAIPTRAIVYR